MRNRIVWGVASVALILLIVGAWLFFGYLPVRADAQMNAVAPHEPHPVSADARALHDTMRVADLHADTLLWMRDPLRRHDRGQTDVPRLLEGGVRLQVFTAVTKSPSGQNYESNTADSDTITLLALAQRWPVQTWGSIFERARYQARRLQRAAARSDGALAMVRTREELDAALAADGVLAGVMGMEGAHPLEGELVNLDRLYADGYRVIGLQHFFDNALGGSLHGVSGAGLTEFGRDVVRRADSIGMIIDVAHSSPAVVEEVLDMVERPVILSHTGVRSLCETQRNIPDALMARIAEGGGLIGIGFWADVTCDDSPAGIARVIIHAAEVFGVEHVALGSDYDGTITAQFDASEMAALTHALVEGGMSEADIRLVMGANAIAFFRANLPSGG